MGLDSWDIWDENQTQEESSNSRFLNMDYDVFKNYIYNTQDISLLKDTDIKRKLIDSPRKYDFIWFVQDASLEILESLLDEEGIEILANTEDVVDKLNSLLTSSKAKDFLFQSKPFCKLVMNHIRYLDSYLYAIEDGAIPFIQYIIEHHPDDLENIFLKLKSTAQKKVLENISFPLEISKKFLIRGSGLAAEYSLANDFRFDSLTNFSFPELFEIASKIIKIPSYLLRKKDFIEKTSSLGDVKNYRFLMNNLSRENDVSEIEVARKKFYDEEISSFLEEENMLKRYYECYQKMCEGIDNEIYYGDIVDDILVHYFHCNGGPGEYELSKHLHTFYRHKDKDGLRKFLEQESHLQLTNMIIDYHFEEIPYNFFIDLKQLIHFQEGEGKTLSDEEITMYSKLLTLDDLSYEEARKLHTQLSQFPMVETYYDQFREAKDKAASLIEEAMLNEESVQKYKDEKLSTRAGVDIYVLDGEEFYVFVKSIGFKNTPLTANSIFYGTDGGSYSLDGSSKLSTFKDPKTNYNIAFKSFPKNQVVHMYPVDSFSNYTRGSNSKATTRVNELHTPKELVEMSNYYNEIILSLPNSHEHDELNAQLKTPEILGIYCYDTITDNDVISAKNLGVGIILVKTKSYQLPTHENKLNMFDTMSLGLERENNYDYLRDISVNDMSSRRK